MILGYSFKSILFFCFIKAIFPLINYDDEPSVPKGILSQLPSSHLFIHWVPAKLQNRVMPYGENRCQLQLLFLFWLLLTCISTNGTMIQWTLYHCCSYMAFVLTSFLINFVVYGFLIQNPADSLNPSEVQQDSGLFFFVFIFWLCCRFHHRLFRPSDIFQQFLRIILYSCLQNRIYHPEQLAGNHY